MERVDTEGQIATAKVGSRLAIQNAFEVVVTVGDRSFPVTGPRT